MPIIFDLTEDTQTTAAIRKMAEKTRRALSHNAVLPPGFISIVAHDLMEQFPALHTVKMRVGAPASEYQQCVAILPNMVNRRLDQ